MPNDRQLCAIKSQLTLLHNALANARLIPAQDPFVRAHIQALETDIASLEQELRKTHVPNVDPAVGPPKSAA